MAIGTGYFAVCCIDEVEMQVLDQFLNLTYETSNTVDCDPRLAVITDVNNSNFDGPTHPPISPFESPFLQKTLHQVAAEVRRIAQREGSNIDNIWFVVLDKGSQSDNTAVLAQINDGSEEEFDVESLRASFEVVNYTLNSLNVGVTSFVEQRELATGTAGVLRHPDMSQKPRGAPAPRMRLGD